MRLRVPEQRLALDPVHDEAVHGDRDVQLDVRRLVVALHQSEGGIEVT